MKKIIFLLLLLSLLVHSMVAADESRFMCVVQESGGAFFNEHTGRWQGTSFQSVHNYLVTPPPGKEGYQIKRVGTDFPFGVCEQGVSEFGYIFCSTFGGDFRINVETGRFVHSFILGYFNVAREDIGSDKEKENTPYIEIGVCSTF